MTWWEDTNIQSITEEKKGLAILALFGTILKGCSSPRVHRRTPAVVVALLVLLPSAGAETQGSIIDKMAVKLLKLARGSLLQFTSSF